MLGPPFTPEALVWHCLPHALGAFRSRRGDRSSRTPTEPRARSKEERAAVGGGRVRRRWRGEPRCAEARLRLAKGARPKPPKRQQTGRRSTERQQYTAALASLAHALHPWASFCVSDLFSTSFFLLVLSSSHLFFFPPLSSSFLFFLPLIYSSFPLFLLLSSFLFFLPLIYSSFPLFLLPSPSRSLSLSPLFFSPSFFLLLLLFLPPIYFSFPSFSFLLLLALFLPTLYSSFPLFLPPPSPSLSPSYLFLFSPLSSSFFSFSISSPLSFFLLLLLLFYLLPYIFFFPTFFFQLSLLSHLPLPLLPSITPSFVSLSISLRRPPLFLSFALPPPFHLSLFPLPPQLYPHTPFSPFPSHSPLSRTSFFTLPLQSTVSIPSPRSFSSSSQ
ncbi:hypothetical protein C7M84_016084 [Penaeus vannamei]|uniref:Uncharacterized protein n=1 Tax=Penaeus vannamei TaxID=6689 RepID=A0A3R7LVX6_PENVA|nr:hypothetical protein C7M84_016084 [Penaeus vannamei]